MLEGVRRTVARWVGAAALPQPLAADNPLLFADHEEIRDIARHLARSKVELDRSLLTLRSWARDLSQRLEESPAASDARWTSARSARRWAGSPTTSTTRSPPSSPIPSSC